MYRLHFAYPLMDPWVVSTFWVLRIMLHEHLPYKYLFKSLLSILLGVESWEPMIILCLVF